MGSRILISTGGTGGHVYPAIALAQQLTKEVLGCEVLFIGGGLDANRYFDRKEFAFKTISCGNFVSKSPFAMLKALKNIIKGIFESRKIIREFDPDVIVGFGSFYSFPSLIAAKSLGVPIILHEGNSTPGKVNRLLSRWAEYTGIHFPETAQALKGKTVEVGMPLRNGFRHIPGSERAAKLYYGFDPEIPVILVFGGSQGSRIINTTVSDILTKVTLDYPFQILHLAGNEQMVPILQDLYAGANIRASVKVFENDMQQAWHAADLMVGRSGAGTIAEQLEFEVPGILIPFANAAENHQDHNADFMAAKVGGAVKLQEKELIAGRFLECFEGVMKNNGTILKAMRQAIVTYKKRVRTRDLCSLVREML